MAALDVLVDARGFGYAAGICAAPADGFLPADAIAHHRELRDHALAQALPHTGSLAVAATWLVEKHAWYVAAAALGGVLVSGRVAPLRDAEVLIGDCGWVEGVALPAAGWRPGGAPELATALAAHLAPLVCALSEHRPPRPLWRSVSDRVGQAAVWCADAFGDADAALALATGVLAAPTPLKAPARWTVGEDGLPTRRRVGCCLSHRSPSALRCDDCCTPASSS